MKTFVSKWQIAHCTYIGLLHVLVVWARCNVVSILVKGKLEVFYIIITSKRIVTHKYVFVYTVQ